MWYSFEILTSMRITGWKISIRKDRKGKLMSKSEDIMSELKLCKVRVSVWSILWFQRWWVFNKSTNIHGNNLSQDFTCKLFSFLSRNVFPKFELPNSGCSLTLSAANICRCLQYTIFGNWEEELPGKTCWLTVSRLSADRLYRQVTNRLLTDS